MIFFPWKAFLTIVFPLSFQRFQFSFILSLSLFDFNFLSLTVFFPFIAWMKRSRKTKKKENQKRISWTQFSGCNLFLSPFSISFLSYLLLFLFSLSLFSLFSSISVLSFISIERFLNMLFTKTKSKRGEKSSKMRGEEESKSEIDGQRDNMSLSFSPSLFLSFYVLLSAFPSTFLLCCPFNIYWKNENTFRPVLYIFTFFLLFFPLLSRVLFSLKLFSFRLKCPSLPLSSSLSLSLSIFSFKTKNAKRSPVSRCAYNNKRWAEREREREGGEGKRTQMEERKKESSRVRIIFDMFCTTEENFFLFHLTFLLPYVRSSFLLSSFLEWNDRLELFFLSLCSTFWDANTIQS